MANEKTEGRTERTGITVVGVCVEIALGEFEIVLGNDLIKGVGAPTEFLAGVAVAEDVGFLLEVDSPADLTTVTLSGVLAHSVCWI